MINYIRYVVYLIVLIGFNVSNAGSYEDFFAAVKLDQPAPVKTLLARGFDPNTVYENGRPALIFALQQGAIQVAELLIDDPRTVIHVQTAQSETPLMLAALRGWSTLCQKLIARDADINRPGWTPLHYAATGGHMSIVQLLLDHYAYIDAESPNGTTPLMMAAQYGNSETVKLLLDAGADPTLKNSLGLTAIDFALSVRKKDSADLLAAAIRARRGKGVW
jgi:ankyrin repeat protein